MQGVNAMDMDKLTYRSKMFLLSFFAILLQSGQIIGACANCKPKYCSSADKCTECFSGYRVERYTCVLCKNNCGECRLTDDLPCKSCRPGYYGQDCQSICPQVCFKSICRRSDGVCSYNCSTGETGNVCKCVDELICGDDILPLDPANPGSSRLPVSVVCMAVAVAVVVVVIGSILLRRRACKRCKETRSTDNEYCGRDSKKAKTEAGVINPTNDVMISYSPARCHYDRAVSYIATNTSENTYAVIEETDCAGLSHPGRLPVYTAQVYDVISGSSQIARNQLKTKDAETYSHINHSAKNCHTDDSYDHVTVHGGHVTVETDTTYGLQCGLSGHDDHVYGDSVDRPTVTSEYTYMDCVNN